MESPKSTPKRKRGMETNILPLRFSFQSSHVPASAEDGSKSPRSHVAHKFRGLLLETADSGDGGVSSTGNETHSDDDTSEVASKRLKTDEMILDEPKEPSSPIVSNAMLPASVEELNDQNAEVTGVSKPHILPAGPESSTTQQPKSNPQSKKRAGTPPPVQHRNAETSSDGAAEVVNPQEDDEDDGTGINGIGFKPTPAIAQARVMKRRQQIADYRKREENDARARRSQRRNAPLKMASLASQHHSPSRRVHFMESEKLSFIDTTL